MNNNFRYATAEDKAFEEALAQPIAQEMIEENAFVQNSMRNE